MHILRSNNNKRREGNEINMIQTEIVSREELKRYLGLLDNMEILGMENGKYTCMGAFDDETQTGMGVLVAEVLTECIHIKRIYVMPEYRRMGVAKKLFQIITDLPEELKQPVVAYGVKEELDQGFLDAMGFHESKSEYTYLEGRLGDYQKLPSPAKESEYSLLPVERVSANALKNYMLEIQKENRIQIPELFAGDEQFSDGSIVCLNGHQIAAVILLEEFPQHILVPFIFGRDKKAILYCFSALREELSEEYGPDARIRFLLNKGRGREAIEKIVANTIEKEILIYQL